MGGMQPLLSAPHLTEGVSLLTLGGLLTPFGERLALGPKTERATGQSPAAGAASAVSIQSQGSVFLRQRRRALGDQEAMAHALRTSGEGQLRGGNGEPPPLAWSPALPLMSSPRPSPGSPHSLPCRWQEHHSRFSRDQGEASRLLGWKVPAVHSGLPLGPCRPLRAPVSRPGGGAAVAGTSASGQMGRP